MTRRAFAPQIVAGLLLPSLAGAGVIFSGGEWDFESGFYAQPNYDRIATVGNGWAWWSDLLIYNGQTWGYGSINENKNPVNVSRGVRSQEITMTCATGWAGLYRTITVPANHSIRVEYDARTTWSEVPALIFTGINLNGGTDHAYNSATTTWYPWGGQPGDWVRVRVTVTSMGDRLTIFVAERHEYPSCSGATFLFDNVEVFDDGPAGPVTPTSTPTATHTPTHTATPINDADGDGVRDELEGHPPAAGQTNRWLPDSDGDGLSDGREDANRNGMRDAGETNARAADTDGDGYEDGIEALLGSDANDPASPATPITDADGDKLPALLDFEENNPDADGDRFSDGYEAQVIDYSAAYNPAQKPALGDANDDGAISNLDALVTQSIFLGAANPAQFASGRLDANRDGFISNVDALALQAFFLGALPLLAL